MRIGIVGTDLAPLDQEVGALEKLCRGWARELSQLGFEVILFSIPFPNGIDTGSPDLRTFSDQNELDYKLLEANLDAVIINNRPAWHGASISLRINLFHNYPDAWMVAAWENLNEELSKTRNLAVSAALAEEINQIFPKAQASVLYPFIDQEILNARNMEQPGRLDRSSTHIRALFPNRTLEKKGLRWLIETIDQHLAGMVSLTVIRNISPWTHETHEHRELLELARSRSYITVAEKIANTSELISLYRDHDVVITPSTRNEGLGLIPIEAQAVGTPVVASGLGGLRESVFEPNQTVPVGSTTELARAILSSVEIPLSERESIAKMVAKRYSPAVSTRNLASELQSLFDSNGLG